MPEHRSSVNFRNLIEDLASMYPFEVWEVVIVELIANALDAKATQISVDYRPADRTLIVQDNGHGMNNEQFQEYHDFAAGLKTKGSGIGFAGLGAKISFHIADRVLTHTKSNTFAGGSDWFLRSKRELVWTEIEPVKFRGTGTRVEVRFRDAPRPLSADQGSIERVLKKHYFPLFDRTFLALYERMGIYSERLRFRVSGSVVAPSDSESTYGLESVRGFYPRKAGKRIGYGILGVAQSEYPVAPDICGVLLCTHGKVVKGDFFNQFPGALAPRILGIVEVPELVRFLTTAKTDFVRGIRTHRAFEAVYGPLRTEFKEWLAALGVESQDVSSADEARKLEQELRKLLPAVPELREFFGTHSVTSVLQQKEQGNVNVQQCEGAENTYPIGQEGTAGTEGPTQEGTRPGTAPVQSENPQDPRAAPISRKARSGLKVAFISSPQQETLAELDGVQVTINVAHPSYRRSGSNPATRKMHNMFAIGSAIQRFISSDPGKDQSARDPATFVDRFLAAWGRR